MDATKFTLKLLEQLRKAKAWNDVESATWINGTLMVFPFDGPALEVTARELGEPGLPFSAEKKARKSKP